MVDCDDVFDVLTRGPFPAGLESDAVVERHLAHCHECQQLAEALRPAVELFQEAITPEESFGLPSYSGRSNTAESRLLAALRQDLATQSRLSTVSRRIPKSVTKLTVLGGWQTGAARFAAAMVLGLAIGGGVQALRLYQRLPEAPVAAALKERPAADSWNYTRALTREMFTRLANVGWKDSCGKEPQSIPPYEGEDPQLASVVVARAQCCTTCHTAGSPSSHAPPETISLACITCHVLPSN